MFEQNEPRPGFDDLLADTASPWRKVSEYPPPKDESEFLVRRETFLNRQGRVYFVFRWFIEAGKYQETMSGMLYSEARISKSYEWMPIP